MKKRFLFISYYFYPDQSVGANRVNYWAELLSGYEEYDVDVISGTAFNPADKLIENQFFVKNSRRHSLLGKVVLDKGLAWKKDILDFFESAKYSEQPDYVIMSGTPFMHFSLVSFLKRKFNCKVALDYRDPFANNPRFNTPLVKRLIKRYFERAFNSRADLIFSVNEDCLDLLGRNPKNSLKYKVIPNGFNEAVFNEVKSNKKKRGNIILYPGKFYPGVSAKPFFEALKQFLRKGNWKFKHIGKESVPGSENVEHLGYRPYKEVVETILTAKIGIIFTGGDKFESTTKVFDYIGGNLSILVITEGKKHTGNLQNILAHYPNVIWSRNRAGEILSCLNRLKETPLKAFDEDKKHKYARKHGLNKMLRAFSQLPS